MGEPIDSSKSPFVSESSFDQLFPNMDDVVFEGMIGDSPYNRSPIGFSIRERGGLIRYPDPKCWSGGFEVDYAASDAMRERLTETIVRLRCVGHVNSYKGRRAGQPCSYSAEGVIKFRPKAPAPGAAQPPAVRWTEIVPKPPNSTAKREVEAVSSRPIFILGPKD